MSELSALEFLSRLRSLNVKLTADGDQLRFAAPIGVMTPDLHQGLALRKREILLFLKEASAASQEQFTPIKPISRDGELPISFAQMRLWLLDQLEPNNSYNIPALFRFKGDLNPAVLEKAFGEIVRRHEVLRAYYLNIDGKAVQKIAPPGPFKIAMVDFQPLSGTEKQKEAERLYASQPFDLGKAPLIRATLLKLGPAEHCLFLDIHHIAFDGWSFGVLLRELSSLYEAFLKEQASPLPELRIQYADFAAWQQQWLQGEVLRIQTDYWKQKLGGRLPILELPADRPRPAAQSYNGDRVSFTFSKRLTDGLKSLSQKDGVTLFVTLLAAFKTLLMRYTSQEDILVGTPIANRNREEIEGLIGFFVNMLVMRTDLSGDPTFRTLMRQVQDMVLGALAHQDLPFEKLVEELSPERDFSRSPISQVMFTFQNMTQQLLELPGLEPSRLEFRTEGAKFDLTLSLEETEQGLTGAWSYNTDLFNASTIERWSSHYKTLLEDIVKNPNQRLSKLQLLTHAEQEQLLIEWNLTKATYPEDQCLAQLFEKQVEATPDAVAVVFEHSSITYRELNERANQLAHYLRDIGVRPDTLVGIFMERSLEMMIALYGVLKAGGAYVPLDPTFPPDRLAYMVEDSGMGVLITHRDLDKSIQISASSIVRLDSNWDAIAKQSISDLKSPDGDPRNLAYVLYTSGSTGKPKGVKIPHSALVNFLFSMQREPGFAETDTLLAVTTLSFDIAGLELHLPLVSGGTVVIASYEETHDPRRLMERMRSRNYSVMQATPTTWRALIDAGWHGSTDLKVLCGGESLPRDLVRKLLPQCKELWNMYGPTETTIWSTIHRVISADSPVLIGRPIANTQTFVLDGHRNTVPHGVVGELYIGGAGLASGYLGLQALTDERFVQSPFEPSARLYRTGDLARWTSDGCLECLGRGDTQVKIRGFRIELGEIEAALNHHEAVRQSVAVVREDAQGDQRIVAYFEPRTETTPTVSDLRACLAKKLPDYMVPTVFVQLPSLPLTPNGKVDRKALPAPGSDLSLPARGYVAPTNPTETKIAAIFAHLLGVAKVGVTDSFFDLGGHSILAVQLFARIERELGVRLPLNSVISAPTVAQIAALLQTTQPPKEYSLVPLQTVGSEPPVFWIPGGTGVSVFAFRDLALRLGTQQPSYGLERLIDDRMVEETVEQRALRCLELIRGLQPRGPYRLAGFCVGGLIAYELAQQLRASGEEVGLLTLINCYFPGAPTTSERFKRLFQRCKFYSSQAVKLPLRDAAGLLTRRVGNKLLGKFQALSRCVRPETPPSIEAKNAEVVYQYRPKPYAGDLTLMVATESDYTGVEHDLDPRLAWRYLTATADVHFLEGEHTSILRLPTVERMADILCAKLGSGRFEAKSSPAEWSHYQHL